MDAQRLSRPPVGAPPLADTLDALGYVQLDSIRNVARAHHHILWSRDQSYRPRDLHRFAFERRGAFEHFGHDASLFPMATWPVWQRRMEQFRRKLPHNKWFARVPDAAGRAAIRDRIAKQGPLCSADFDHEGPKPKGMWERPPTKLALDFMWYCGELSTAYRADFRKYYDLTERVVPTDLRDAEMSDTARIDWLCRGALDRLGFATPGEIKRFWEACSTQEVRAWLHANSRDFVEVELEAADGSYRHAFALADIEARLDALGKPTSRLRVLNPFDPAVRDRKRLSMLFGFDYVNEIFVPKAKRRWGYYVYPVLDGDRMVARIDLSGGPKTGLRPIQQQWIEDSVRWSARRQERLEAEVARLSRMAG
ncbi:MAG: crosslink repair DNA glycosylase YcaQ family protein [Pseudomonadota bacterium]